MDYRARAAIDGTLLALLVFVAMFTVSFLPFWASLPAGVAVGFAAHRVCFRRDD